MSTISESDKFYINAYSNFISKFECAINIIKHHNFIISDTYDSSILRISNRNLDRKRYPNKTFYCLNYPNNHWYIDRSLVGTDLYPFAIIMEGRYSRSRGNLYHDIDHLFKFVDGTANAFSQGFLDAPAYKDCWVGYHWSLQSGFHLGRYFLNKFLNKKLSYRLHPYIQNIIKK